MTDNENTKSINDLLVEEIILEQHISPNIKSDEILNYIKDGIYSINERIGEEIDYSKDLVAKSLLKNYCLYARYKRLAEFYQVYEGDFVKLQIKYNRDSNV